MYIGLADPEEKDEWNAFVVKHSDSEFLQSWGWGEFQKSYGRRVWRFIVRQDEKIYAVGMAVCSELIRGRHYVYVSRAPIFNQSLSRERKRVIWSLFTQQWRLIGLESNSIFIRVEPRPRAKVGEEELKDRAKKFLLGRGWIQVKRVQPQYTTIISLKESEEAILSRMHQKTRYNIRLAEKKNLKFRMIIKEKEFKIFWDLHSKTAKRDNFATYPYDYYRKLFNILLDEDDKPDARRAVTRIFVIEKEDGTPLTAALIITYGKRVYYLFGGSNHEHRNLMAPYLLHWSIIKRAKKNGFEEYDLWGITPPGKTSDESWQGFSRFKNGFGGAAYCYPGTFDFPYRPYLYKAYQFARKVKRFVRL